MDIWVGKNRHKHYHTRLSAIFSNKYKFCHQNTLIKYGRKNGRQRYKCSACQKFLPTPKPLDNDHLLYEHIHLKQTCAQIAKHYQCSAKTIHRRIKQGDLITNKSLKPVANIIMDSTYFGSSFGVMVFMNQLDGNIIHKQHVIKETAALYELGLTTIMKKVIHIQSITADGFKGIARLFPDIPFQLCQFHQQQTIRRCLTCKPKSDAARVKEAGKQHFYVIRGCVCRIRPICWKGNLAN